MNNLRDFALVDCNAWFLQGNSVLGNIGVNNDMFQFLYEGSFYPGSVYTGPNPVEFYNWGDT